MNEIAALHKAEFETSPDIVVKAPGIIKLLGDHTEAYEGLSLAISAGFSVSLAVSRRKDTALRFYAADFNERKRTTLSGLKYKREDRWANYIKAPLAILAESGALSSGYSFSISGDIPQGLGFASSTALVLSAFISFRELLGLKIADADFRLLVLRAESEFLGVAPGFVEVAASTIGRKNQAVLADIKQQTATSLPFSFSDYTLIITDSRVPRFSVDSELKSRQGDCRRCLSALSTKKRQIKSLRECSLEDLSEAVGTLPESARRRCTYVLEEMRRVQDAGEALKRKDAQAFGRLMNRSHDGLRDLYEVSCPEVDWLVKRALEIDGTLCSRMTGKGFGGCTITFIKRGAIEEYKKRLEEYERIFGFRPAIRETELGDKAGILC
jgi:galactokinase